MLRLKHFRQLYYEFNRLPTVSVSRTFFWQKGPEEKDTATGAAYDVKDLVKQSHKPAEVYNTNYTSAICKFSMKDVETELLSYPEVADEEKLNVIEQSADNIKNVLGENQIFTKSTLEQIKSLDLLKYNVSIKYGGKGYSLTETLRASEAETINLESAMILNAHRGVCSIISRFGNQKQQEKYLPKLTSGNENKNKKN